MFPEKHRVLKYYSLHMIIYQEYLDYEKHIKIPFVTYVLANNKLKTTNMNAPGLFECIYLRAKDIAQGGHELLHLQTNSVITRNHITPASITPTIINQLNSIADR